MSIGVDQWEDFLLHNTEAHSEDVYSFSSDIDFLEIYPDGCTETITIYPEIDGGKTTWKNLFMIGAGNTLDFCNGVHDLNIKNMFSNCGIRWDKKLYNINMSMSGARCFNITKMNPWADEVTIHNNTFTIRGTYGYHGASSADGIWFPGSDNDRLIVENCFVDVDADCVLAYFERADAYNTTIIGRLCGYSYLRSALNARGVIFDTDPTSPDPEHPDYIPRERTNYTIYNFAADSRSCQYLNYHGGNACIIYNKDIANWKTSTSDMDGRLGSTIEDGTCLLVADPNGVRHKAPGWKMSQKFEVPVYEEMEDDDVIPMGAFLGSRIKEVTLPPDCRYCKNSFPPRVAIYGGQLANYKEGESR